MNLFNFLDEETKQKISNIEQNNFEKKNEKFDELKNSFVSEGLTEPKATAKAQEIVFKPEVLENINLNSDIKFGLRKKISFYVSDETLKKIKIYYDLIQKDDELLFSDSDVNKILDKLTK